PTGLVASLVALLRRHSPDPGPRHGPTTTPARTTRPYRRHRRPDRPRRGLSRQPAARAAPPGGPHPRPARADRRLAPCSLPRVPEPRRGRGGWCPDRVADARRPRLSLAARARLPLRAEGRGQRARLRPAPPGSRGRP